MLGVPLTRRTLHTPHTPEALAARVKTLLTPAPLPFIKWRTPASEAGKPMVHGDVSTSGFRLVAHAYTRTLYLPVCEGAFEPTETGTDLRYTLRPKIGEAVIFGLAGLGFAAYGVVSGTITPIVFATAAHLFAYFTGFMPAQERISSALEQAGQTDATASSGVTS